MDLLRIEIMVGNGGTSEDGTDLFKPEYKQRIEFTSMDVLKDANPKMLLTQLIKQLDTIKIHSQINERSDSRDE